MLNRRIYTDHSLHGRKKHRFPTSLLEAALYSLWLGKNKQINKSHSGKRILFIRKKVVNLVGEAYGSGSLFSLHNHVTFSIAEIPQFLADHEEVKLPLNKLAQR